MLQRWQAVGKTGSDLTARDLNLIPPAPETNALLLDQPACGFILAKEMNESCYFFSRVNRYIE